MICNTSDFQLIADRRKGEWLEASASGELRTLRGAWQKAWFLIRDFATCGFLHRRTAQAITAVSKRFFDDICARCPSPLETSSPAIRQSRGAIERLAQAIRRLPPRLCDQKIARYILDLQECPEVAEARLALDRSVRPTLVSEGISGSYLLYNRQGRPWAVFKPEEQEPGMRANPKGFGDLKPFLDRIQIAPGTSFQRERAAYLLDRGHFSGVPLTTVAEMPRRFFIPQGSSPFARGSFQKFVPGCTHAWDHYQILPWPLSSADGHRIPVHEIHKIAILDIRTLNSDRHLKNFLVDSHFQVYPIDHGFTFPGNASNLRFNWMNFNQSKEPFSPEELRYIEELDPDADIELLKREAPSLSAASLLRCKAAALLLKRCARRGLTAFQIGELMCGRRADFLSNLMNRFVPLPLDQPSYFETAICSQLKPGMPIEPVLDRHIDRYLNL